MQVGRRRAQQQIFGYPAAPVVDRSGHGLSPPALIRPIVRLSCKRPKEKARVSKKRVP
jgi:hypothetical protein